MVDFLWDNLFKKNKQEEIAIKRLKKTHLFSQLTRKELVLLSKHLHIRQYRPKEPVFRQGEMGVGLYVVIQGHVNIHSRNDLELETKETLITRLGPGDFFGELALVEENDRRTASASACDEALLAGFFQPDLHEMIDRYPNLAVKILLRLSEILGTRLKETTTTVSALKRELKAIDTH